MRISFAKTVRSLLFFLFLIFTATFIQGQNSETGSLLAQEKIKPTFTSFGSLASLQDSFSPLTGKIDEAQRQIESRRSFTSYQDLGTHFSPLLNLASLSLPSTGFVSGNTSLTAFQKDFNDRKFYDASMPFTAFKYAQGGQQYIQFDALHTQNIIPSWNFAAGIQSFTNQGFGLRQTQFHRAPFITSHFTLPNNRVRVITSLNWVRRTGHENGGLAQNDSTFVISETDTSRTSFAEAHNLLTPGINRNAMSTEFSNAFDTVKLTNHLARVQYNIGSQYLDLDDSIKKVKPVVSLYYQFAFKKETWIFQDDALDTGFFENRYLNGSAVERDSQRFITFGHEFGVNKVKQNANGVGLGGYLGVEQGSYSQNTNVQLGTLNTYIGGRIDAVVASRVALGAKAKVFLSGYNGGDYKLDALALLNTNNWSFMSSLNSQLYEPAPQNKFFVTQGFSYLNNSFKKVLSNSISAGAVQRNAKHPLLLSVKLQNLNNYVFYNSQRLPEQVNGAFQFIHLSMKKRFNYKSVNASVTAFTQQVSHSKIELPAWGLKLDGFYQNYVSDSNLLLKTGFDLSSHASFDAAGYMPVLRQFYFKSGTQLGAYPLLDVYVSGEVKNLVFFAKMENVLDAYYVQRKVRSYSTYAYPVQPMAFRLGLLWDFYY